MNSKISRVSLIKSLNKKQLLSLLGSILSFQELQQLLNFNSKEQILKILSSLYSREYLNDVLNSNLNISTELISNYYENSFNYEKNKPNQQNLNENQYFTEIKKVEDATENTISNSKLNMDLANEKKIVDLENNLEKLNTKNDFRNENIENENNKLKIQKEISNPQPNMILLKKRAKVEEEFEELKTNSTNETFSIKIDTSLNNKNENDLDFTKPVFKTKRY